MAIIYFLLNFTIFNKYLLNIYYVPQPELRYQKIRVNSGCHFLSSVGSAAILPKPDKSSQKQDLHYNSSSTYNIISHHINP
jgi:hypothetical protein